MSTERPGNSDPQLVDWTLTGDCSAFASIVKRRSAPSLPGNQWLA
jgi:hypothetical protein